MKEANKIGVSGWVRNVDDGSVELAMRAGEDKLDKMMIACQSGPMLARVDAVKFIDAKRSDVLPMIVDGVFKKV